MDRRLLTTVADAMVVVDEAGRIVLVNTAAEAMFGYGPDELPGHPVDVLIPASLRETYREHRRAFFANRCLEPINLDDCLQQQNKESTSMS